MSSDIVPEEMTYRSLPRRRTGTASDRREAQPLWGEARGGVPVILPPGSPSLPSELLAGEES